MRKLIAVAFLLCVATSFGCAPTNPTGTFYSKTKVPTDALKTSVGDKTGKSCRSIILGNPTAGLLSFGDATVESAAKNGGIKKVSNVDAQITTVFIFYAQKCTVVTGS